jgi:hypothetical protein
LSIVHPSSRSDDRSSRPFPENWKDEFKGFIRECIQEMVPGKGRKRKSSTPQAPASTQSPAAKRQRLTAPQKLTTTNIELIDLSSNEDDDSDLPEPETLFSFETIAIIAQRQIRKAIHYDFGICSYPSWLTVLEMDTVLEFEYILNQEKETLSNRHGNMTQLKWELAGSVDDNIQSLLQIISNINGPDLRELPKLQIHGLNAVDLTGVFTDRINLTWDYLLHKSGIFVYDKSNQFYTFSEVRCLQSLLRNKALYLVAGKIFRWFILHKQIIPYPVELDPSIFGFGMLGCVPPSILGSLNPYVARLYQYIESTDSTQASMIINDEIREVLQQINMSETEFIRQFESDSVDGPSLVARKACTSAIIGWRGNQYQWFRTGFNDNLGFKSVYHIPYSLIVDPFED